ncbi:MAG: serine/threonine-protein kinase, partial [Acidobacteriota bacterium]|nr:serine/threonine-protein kinase [Acidobacteriota bacterium]
MKAERWQQVERLYHAALESEPESRASFLDEACAGDAELRGEVESLLGYEERAERFIESPALEVAAGLMAEDGTPAMSGRRISHYKIISSLGAGGMGEVYLAEDTTLRRKVALKLLPDFFTKDPDRLRRFAQEARAASALNHPNIITIHEIGEIEDTHYIVIEYVAGETLRRRIASTSGKGMKLAEAVEMAAQIAAALAAAHEAGITHRDIKPENVMVRPDGIVKVLDFGLAKLTEVAPSVVDSRAATLVRNDTETGMVMGTPGYMSPEQARGEKVDARTDIFSLGAMLYEMVVGRAPFAGATTSETIAALLRDEPPPLIGAPPALARIVSRALHKDRSERYQTANEMLADLRRHKQNLDIESHSPRAASPEGGDETATANVAARSTAPRAGRSRGSSFSPRRAVIYAGVLIALTLGALGYAWRWRQTSVAPQAEIKSLAVLPLKSLDAGENYLGLGIADAVIRRISQTGELIVRPTSAVRRYLNEDTDALAAARQLNADAVLEGSVQRADDRLRVSVNLLRTADG